MEGQQPYKSSKKWFDLIKEGINKRIQKGTNKRLEEETNKMIEYRIKKLEDLLNEMVKNAQEKANLPEIEGYHTIISLNYNIRGNDCMWCKQLIITDIYNKDERIRCESYISSLPNKIICTNHIDKSFELPDSIYFIQGIKKTIPDILNPRALKHKNKQYINIYVDFSMDLNKPIKENPEISKYGNLFSYNNGRSIIKMDWRFY